MLNKMTMALAIAIGLIAPIYGLFVNNIYISLFGVSLLAALVVAKWNSKRYKSSD